MNKILCILAGIVLLQAFSSQLASCEQTSSRYVTLQYTGKEELRTFADNIELPTSLSQQMRKNAVTTEEEVLAKTDIIVEKAETVLDMFPANLHFTLILLPSAKDISKVFFQKYSKNVDYLSFYSLSEKTIYISVKDANLHVLAHEIGHAIVDHFFNVRPPYNIHELMAQFTEKHITD